MVENPVVIWWHLHMIDVREQVNLIGLTNFISACTKTWNNEMKRPKRAKQNKRNEQNYK